MVLAKKISYILFSISLLLTAGVFIGDILSPLGIAGGVPYVIVVLTAFWFQKPASPIILAVLCSVLTLVGWLLSPSGADFGVVALNRGYAILGIWGVGIALNIHINSREKLIRQKDSFYDISNELRQQLAVLNKAAIMSITDANGKILQVNDLFCKISGYEREELIGKNHRILKSGKQPDGLYTGMWAALSQGKTWQGEICNKTKDGRYYWVATTIAPFTNELGEIEKFVSIRFDITLQKSQAIELEKRANNLKSTNKKLAVANKQLESFSYSVSHDLKAPLRAIQGFSRTLFAKYKDSFDEEGERWLHYIQKNASDMDLLIRELLEYSKMSRSDIDKHVIRVNPIIKDVIDKIIPAYEGKKINFDIDELPDAYADHRMLSNVWQNLIDNALKYSSKNEEIHIKIIGERLNDRTEYSIIDNGTGFDMAYSDKLFTVFQRLHSRNEFDGNGIGLATIKRIIDKHGGEITAYSKPGEGAKFTFFLPAK